MKKLFAFVCVILLVTISKEAKADESFEDYFQRYNQLNGKYYEYMYDRKAVITNNRVQMSFRWSETSMFKAGDEFEIGVIINPKSFAKPASGNDYTLQGDIQHNLECGFRDVFNYTVPPDPAVRFETIINQCEEFGVEFSSPEQQWLATLSVFYWETFEDKVASFGIGSTCPENFIPHKEYLYEYAIEPLTKTEIQQHGIPEVEPECGGNSTEGHEEWGYASINAKVQPDTLVGVFFPQTIEDCPYLIGIPETPVSKENSKPPVILANRICATTSELILPIQDPESRGWKNNSAWQTSCKDCDGDMLYDTDFPVSMYGSRAIDCNDQCHRINICSEDACNTGDFCSEQCGGDGCEYYPVASCPFVDAQDCQEVGVCTAGETNTEDCWTILHERKRTCLDSCQWSDWSTCELKDLVACTDCPVELPDECENPDCNPGETKSQECGTGGTQTASCTDECAWTAWGDCEGSGSCEPTQTLGCGNCGTMTCQADGQWGACETQGICTPGETQQQSCDGSGTQVRSCNGLCEWDSWGVCQNGCTCAGGECCDGCNYISSGTSCDLSYEFQCEGSSPGQNVQRRQVLQYCSGVDAGCSGSFDYGSWQTWEDCSSSQECEYVSGTPECVGSCQDVYLASSSSACFDNPQGSGNPTLCLYVQQNSGSSWEYQICKNGGAFQQDFTYRLRDDNHGVNYTQYSASAGTQCTPWRTFTVNQISAYGALNGAGLNGYVASPAGCSQAACQYNTGGITIRLECQ